jgi:hypothetical protein
MLLTYVKKPLPKTSTTSSINLPNLTLVLKEQEENRQKWKKAVEIAKEKFPVGTLVTHTLSGRQMTVTGYQETPYIYSKDFGDNPRVLLLFGVNGVAALSQSMNEVIHANPENIQPKIIC